MKRLILLQKMEESCYMHFSFCRVYLVILSPEETISSLKCMNDCDDVDNLDNYIIAYPIVVNLE